MQDLIRKLPGVISTRVGYSGGDVPNATYRNHGGHAEAVEIVFDPDKISYRDLLEFFFQIHDPTTKNRQGNDVGTSYRSAIFYTTEAQKKVAEDTIADVEASGLWPGQVVTEVTPAGPFWEAEPEHQDYLERYPQGYTCHFVRPGWKLPHRARLRHQLSFGSASPLAGSGQGPPAWRAPVARRPSGARRGLGPRCAPVARRASGARVSVAGRARCQPTPMTQTGVSRRTSEANLSGRRPWKLGWRSRPSVVHSVNATAPTSSGRAQCADFSCTGSKNGEVGTSKARRFWCSSP